MNLKHRRILTITFGIIFLIAAPLIILYASGFRFDLKQKRLERVGLIYVTTDPNYTKLILDGQTHDVGNELLVSNLKAKDYDVIVTKDGYHSWIKKLEVKQGETTFIRNLLLFKEQEPTPLEVFDQDYLVLLQDKNAIILQNADRLIIFQPEDNITTEIKLLSPVPIQDILYTNPTIFTFEQDDIWYQTTPEGIESINQRVPSSIIIMSKTVDNDLYALTDTGIYRIGPALTETPTIQHALAQDIFHYGNRYLIISTEPSKQRSFLYEIVSEGTRPRLIHTLPYSPTYKIENDVNGFLTIADQENKKLFLVDTNANPAEVVELNGVHSWEWSQDNQQLLTATDFELTIHHFDNGETQELLLRLSSPITQAAWHPEGQHVFYLTGESLYIVERDNRQQRNVFPLIENKKNLQILAVDPDGKKIWTISTDDSDQLQVSEIEIRD